jgi:histidine ammonia-lyase
LQGFALAPGTQAAYDEIRRQIPACLDGDRWFHDDIAVAHGFVIGGSVRAAVEGVVGALDHPAA